MKLEWNQVKHKLLELNISLEEPWVKTGEHRYFTYCNIKHKKQIRAITLAFFTSGFIIETLKSDMVIRV